MWDSPDNSHHLSGSRVHRFPFSWPSLGPSFPSAREATRFCVPLYSSFSSAVPSALTPSKPPTAQPLWALQKPAESQSSGIFFAREWGLHFRLWLQGLIAVGFFCRVFLQCLFVQCFFAVSSCSVFLRCLFCQVFWQRLFLQCIFTVYSFCNVFLQERNHIPVFILTH